MSVHTIDCPNCDGDGMAWYDAPLGWFTCRECNGTGERPVLVLPKSEPSGRQLLWGAVLCAAVAAALILMFASKL